MPEDSSECIEFKAEDLEISVRSVSSQWKVKETSELLRKVISYAVRHLGLGDLKNKSMDFLLVDDNVVKQLNKTYRSQDKPTNVLSFQAQRFIGACDDGVPKMLGSVALSIDTIKREAQEQTKSLDDHTAHLALHGLLHLLGYDHNAEDDAKVMENKEVEILRDLAIANPYKQENDRGAAIVQ
ncbi:MAG: rRNA maturation RNase YbeY [Holosporales bacterium]|jgi:probable rRNA maturation factor|nr:rRNA maturation RNase YbeY [Holosporales bacterium]